MYCQIENINKEIENILKESNTYSGDENHSSQKKKNTKSSQQNIWANGRISELEDKSMRLSSLKKEEKIKKKNPQSFRDPWATILTSIIETTEEEKKRKNQKKYLKKSWSKMSQIWGKPLVNLHIPNV